MEHCAPQPPRVVCTPLPPSGVDQSSQGKKYRPVSPLPASPPNPNDNSITPQLCHCPFQWFNCPNILQMQFPIYAFCSTLGPFPKNFACMCEMSFLSFYHFCTNSYLCLNLIGILTILTVCHMRKQQLRNAIILNQVDDQNAQFIAIMVNNYARYRSIM